MDFVSSPVDLLVIGAVTYLCWSLPWLWQVLGTLPGNEPCQILMVIQLFSKNMIINTASTSPQCYNTPRIAISASMFLKQKTTNKNKNLLQSNASAKF
jgi:hypothetical protein